MKTFLYLLLITLSMTTHAKKLIPDGFKTIAKEQSNFADIIFGGRILGSFLVKFDTNDIQIAQPLKVIAKISDLKEPDKALSYFSGKKATNSALSCSPIAFIGCGNMKTNNVSFIFDPTSFQLILIINPTLLITKETVEKRYLPDSKAGMSLIHYADYHYSSNESDQKFNLSGTTYLGYKNTRLRVETTIDSSDSSIIDEYFMDRDRNGFFYGGGLFKTKGESLLGSLTIVGGVWSSSLRTRMDKSQLDANRISVFLQNDSKVEIYKDKRLLSVNYYESGNQIIDTQDLPLGTYDILIKIINRSGQIREEKRLLIKDSGIPPLNMTFYRIEGGLIKDDLIKSGDDQYLFNVSLNKRISIDLLLGGNAFIYGDYAGISPFFHYFEKSFRLKGNAIVTESGNKGILLDYAVRLKENITLNTRLIKTTVNNPQDITPIFGFNSAGIKQINTRLSMPVGKGTAQLTYQMTETPSSYDYNAGLNYRQYHFSDSGQPFSSSFQYSQTNQSRQIMATLSINLFDKKSLTSISNSLRMVEHNPSLFFVNVSNNQDKKLGGSDIKVNSYFSGTSDTDYQAGGGMMYYGDKLTADIGAEYAFTDRVNKSLYINIKGGFLTTDTSAYQGNGDQNEAGIAVSLVGDMNEDNLFNVLLNDSVVAKNIKVGEHLMFPVSAYKEHKISIKGVKSPFVQYDYNSRYMTLYPGNVIAEQWIIKKIYLVYGQLVDDEDNPIGNKIMTSNKVSGQTNKRGYFQMELPRNSVISSRTNDGELCHADINIIENTDFVSMGKVTCHPDKAPVYSFLLNSESLWGVCPVFIDDKAYHYR